MPGLFQFLGSIIGSVTFGPVGFGLGGLVGSLFDSKPKVYGPRLGDYGHSTTRLGTPIPDGYGSFTVYPHTLWNPGVLEVKEVTEEGGFLFFGGTEKVSYEYFLTGHFGLCEGPIDAVNRIWDMNSGLKIADFSNGVDSDVEASTAWLMNYIKIYHGTADQSPSSWTMNRLGGGITSQNEVPRYPNLAYMDVKNLPLGRFQNNPKLNWKFEIFKNGTTIPEQWKQVTPTYTHFSGRSLFGLVEYKNQLVVIAGFSNSTNLEDIWVSPDGKEWNLFTATTVQNFFGVAHSIDPVVIFSDTIYTGVKDLKEYVCVYGGVGSDGSSNIVQLSTGNYIIGYAFGESKRINPIVSVNQDCWPRHAYASVYYKVNDDDLPKIFITGGECVVGNPYGVPAPIGGSGGATGGFYQDIYGSSNGMDFSIYAGNGGFDYRYHHSMIVWKNRIWLGGGIVESPGDANNSNHIFQANADVTHFTLKSTYFQSYFSVVGVSSGEDYVQITNAPSINSWFEAGNTITLIGPDGGTFTIAAIDSFGGTTRIYTNEDITGTDIAAVQIPDWYDNGDVWGVETYRKKLVVLVKSVSGGTLDVYDSDDGQSWTQVSSLTPSTFTMGDSGLYPSIINFRDMLWVIGGEDTDNDVTNLIYRTALPTVARTEVSLATAITDRLTNKLNLDVSKIDVSDLTGLNFYGLPIYTPSSTREIFADIFMAFGIDVIRSQGTVIFKQRKNAETGISIPHEDLQLFSSNQSIPEYLNMSIESISKSPTEITLEYIDFDLNYEFNTQVAQNFNMDTTGATISETVNRIKIQLLVVLSADQARATAHFLLWNYLTERTKFPITVNALKYFKLDNGDIFNIVIDDVGTFKVRAVEIAQNNINSITISCALDYADLYVIPDLGDTSQGVDDTHVNYFTDNVEFAFLDIPALIPDHATKLGFYFCAGIAQDIEKYFVSASLYRFIFNRSFGDEYTYKSGSRVTKVNPIGTLTDASGMLSNVNPFVWDDTSELVIQLDSGTIQSIADPDDYNETNYAAIGTGSTWEIVQVKSSVYSGSGTTYTLSGFRRGLFGTEQNLTHINGDSIVLLESIRPIQISQSELNRANNYKITLNDASAENGIVTQFTCQSNRTRPLAPLNIQGFLNANGSWVIQFAPQVLGQIDIVDGIIQNQNQEKHEERFRITFYSDNTFVTELIDFDVSFQIGDNIETLYQFVLGKTFQINSTEFSNRVHRILYVGIAQYAISKYTINNGLGIEGQTTLTI